MFLVGCKSTVESDFSLSFPKSCRQDALGTLWPCGKKTALCDFLLWVCYIVVELKVTKCCLPSKGPEGPQSILPTGFWEAKRKFALHSALTAYQEHLLQRPLKRSFFAGLIWLK